MFVRSVATGRVGGWDAPLKGALPAVTEKYGKWDFFSDFAKTDILNTAAELRGDKRIPKPEASASAAP
jgi:hypothetical protein